MVENQPLEPFPEPKCDGDERSRCSYAIVILLVEPMFTWKLFHQVERMPSSPLDSSRPLRTFSSNRENARLRPLRLPFMFGWHRWKGFGVEVALDGELADKRRFSGVFWSV